MQYINRIENGKISKKFNNKIYYLRISQFINIKLYKEK